MKSYLLAATTAVSIAVSVLSPVADAAIESRDTLKTYFETGDVPTQDQFSTLIDSEAGEPGQRHRDCAPVIKGNAQLILRDPDTNCDRVVYRHRSG